jgi:predicted Zn-dependent peptidase
LVNTLDLKWLIKTFPAVIATYILGGDFNSYLNMNLREEHGWTYGASTVGAGKYVSKSTSSVKK